MPLLEPVSYTHLDVYKRQVALNALAVELFQLDGETAPGNPFEWLVKHSYLEQDILDTPEDWKTVVNIGERQCYMTFASVELSGITTRIVRFRDVNRAQANDSNMRRLLYQKHKGHVAKYHFENLCICLLYTSRCV